MSATTIIPICELHEEDQPAARSSSARDAERGIPIRSISRAIAVLQAVNRAGSISMMEIAHASNLPYPTACRIVQTLLYEELIERESVRKRYRPTAMVQTLSMGYQGHGALVRATHPNITALTREIGWPISLSTHVGSTMLLRDSTHSLTSLTFNEYHPGFAMPILDCAAGLVHLAFCDDEERATILDHLARFGNKQIDHMLKLTREGLIEQVANQGYATRDFNSFTLNPGKTSSIAVPLIVCGEIVGALTVAFFASTIAMRDAVLELLPRLRDCADAIVADLEHAAKQERQSD